MKYIFAFLLLVISITIYKLIPSKTSPIGELGMQFEYLGCAGDWDDDIIQIKITKEDNQNKSFFIQDPATCGLDEAIHPEYKIKDNILMLSYSYKDTDGVVAACICKYQSRFTFKIPPKNIERVEFNSH